MLCQAIRSSAQEITYQIYFDSDKTEIPDSALLFMAKLFAQHTFERVYIAGHCDSIGSMAYNQQLSERRALTIKKLCISNGIAASSIQSCIGFGKSKPAQPNHQEINRALNRRVQIILYEKEKTNDIQPAPEIIATDLTQQKLEAGKQFVLQNLLFIPGKHIVKPESIYVLQALLQIMLSHPTLIIEIQGHVCCTLDEPDGYDWDEGTHNLSTTRAEAVYQFLLKNGIAASRMQAVGYGGSKKINEDESSEDLRAANRRVEIKILRL